VRSEPSGCQEFRNLNPPAPGQFSSARNLSKQIASGVGDFVTLNLAVTGRFPGDKNFPGIGGTESPSYAECALITSRAITSRWISLVPS